jgi:hypothetical protein
MTNTQGANEPLPVSRGLLVIVAHAFPPSPLIGGARPFRFYKYLPESGYARRVITATKQRGSAQPDVQCVPDDTLESRAGFAFQFERATRKFLLPGEEGITWAHRAAAAARQIVQEHPQVPVTIFSTFPPLGAHLAALELAVRWRLPWVADFRDPFALDPSRTTRSYQKAFGRVLESRVFRLASAIIANTDAMAARWREVYPHAAHKIHVIWNGYDPEDDLGPAPIASAPYKLISHAGELYGGRHPGAIIDSIDRLIAAGKLLPEQIRLRLMGPVDHTTTLDSDSIRRAFKTGWLDIIPRQCPREQARELATKSDGLLLLQPQSAVQVPGKLFEYIRIGRPILALIARGSPVERILAQSGIAHRCVHPDDAPALVDEQILSFLSLPNQAQAPSQWFRDEFNAHNQAAALCKVIDSLGINSEVRKARRQTPPG